MRIKSPLIILNIILGSIVISSCLDSDEVTEFSSNATITSFGIDTIHGVEYEFEIDQIRNLIYNPDSLPVGSDTIIDKILITDITTAGMAVTSADTILMLEDSVNLLPAMNKEGSEGMQFKAHAADGITTRTYTLQIRVHLQEPDSLVWKNMAEEKEVFSQTPTTGEQKAVILNDELLVFNAYNHLYRTSCKVGEYEWEEASVSGLPADTRLNTMLNYNNALYVVTGNDGKIYKSDDATTWNEASGLGNRIVTLVAEVNGKLVAIVEKEDGKKYFNTCDGTTWDANDNLEEVPDNFPLENLYSTHQANGNGVIRTFIVGKAHDSDRTTTPWYSENGTLWGDLYAPSGACPLIDNPFITYYGGSFYIFGGQMDAIYTGLTGIAWEKTETMFLLPEAFKGKANYSIVVDHTVSTDDKRDFIWVVFGGHGAQNEVWRGRLNRLGFNEQ